MRTLAVEQRQRGLVGDLLDALAGTAQRIGWRVRRISGVGRTGGGDLTVVWNGRHLRNPGPTLFCEHGWLPRWEYQVSHAGVNADSHLAPFAWDGKALSAADAAELERRLERIRAGDPAERAEMRAAAPPVGDLPDEFLLVPQQMEGDTNIVRHVPLRYRRMQALLDDVAAARPPWPVIFKQHPSDVARGGAHLRLRVHRPFDAVRPHHAGNVHQLLKSGRCRGIVSLNSNVVHDGLLWDVPAVVLGQNVWPRTDPSPFLRRLPADWGTLAGHLDSAAVQACRQAYAWYLIRNQWSLDDARDPERVEQLLELDGHASAARAPGMPVSQVRTPAAPVLRAPARRVPAPPRVRLTSPAMVRGAATPAQSPAAPAAARAVDVEALDAAAPVSRRPAPALIPALPALRPRSAAVARFRPVLEVIAS